MTPEQHRKVWVMSTCDGPCDFGQHPERCHNFAACSAGAGISPYEWSLVGARLYVVAGVLGVVAFVGYAVLRWLP